MPLISRGQKRAVVTLVYAFTTNSTGRSRQSLHARAVAVAKTEAMPRSHRFPTGSQYSELRRRRHLTTWLQLSWILMNELVFEVSQESDGGYCAECLTEGIFAQADTWEELRTSVVDAVNGFYFDSKPPSKIRLHLVRDEVLSVA